MEELAHNGRDTEKVEKKSKSRFMKKLFKDKDKDDRTPADEEGNLNDFLHGPADKLHMMPPASPGFPPTSPGYPPPRSPIIPPNPPSLTRIDTSNARRWPTAAAVTAARQPSVRSATPPKRSRKGLIVRFTNDQPNIIGEGGDEAEDPVAEIGIRRKAHTHPQGHQANQIPPVQPQQPLDFGFSNNSSPNNGSTQVPFNPDSDESFRPGLLRRTQTGFQSIQSSNQSTESLPSSHRNSPGSSSSNLAPTNNDHYEPTSFAARVRAEMRSGEGKALLQAVPSSPTTVQAADAYGENDDLTPQLKELRMNTIRNSYISSSHISSSQSNIPASLQPAGGTSIASERSTPIAQSPPQLSRASTLQSVVVAAAEDAFQEFSSRVSHLFSSFHRATEDVKSLSTCSAEEIVRLALWWFLKGRMNLEATVHDKPTSPESERRRHFALQQAHADLAKSLWLTQIVMGQRSEYTDPFAGNGGDPNNAIISESRHGILSNLKKLTMSMQKHRFLPQDTRDMPLPQGLDNSIWGPEEGNKSLVTSQRPTLTLSVAEAFPLGDSTKTFQYARMFADGILEEAAAQQYYRCPVLISLVRNQQENELMAIVASQDGGLKLCISADRSRGPLWNDVAWQQKGSFLRVELPRGFTLRLNFSEPDFRSIWASYDYQTKIHASLEQRSDELLLYEVVLKSFHFIDPKPESRLPKEPLPSCFFRMFERIHSEKGTAGMMTMHRGFRVAMNTHPKTKILRGIDEQLPPNLPIQYGFFGGENGQPAMLLKIVTPRSNYKIILTFDDVGERTRLSQLISGTALARIETVVAEAPMKAFSLIGASSDPKNLNCLKTLDWKGFRVINEDEGSLECNKTVLSENLRVTMDFTTGKFTDRINVGTGELKIRLDVKSSRQLKIFREPQQDISLSVMEAHVSHELPHELAEVLDVASKSQTIRTYLFPGLSDLHLFQAAITGYVVQYDGTAASFNIARRRMVVPIYKKWDAMSTRLQVVKREKVTQLLAFFEGFSHGDCMSFPLKSTDIFETSGKSGKYSLRIVDCKFAMPKARPQGEEDKGMSDHEFVCLDVPEYPGEHDDITIVFETEPGI
jgi:hypothetical protein